MWKCGGSRHEVPQCLQLLLLQQHLRENTMGGGLEAGTGAGQIYQIFQLVCRYVGLARSIRSTRSTARSAHLLLDQPLKRLICCEWDGRDDDMSCCRGRREERRSRRGGSSGGGGGCGSNEGRCPGARCRQGGRGGRGSLCLMKSLLPRICDSWQSGASQHGVLGCPHNQQCPRLAPRNRVSGAATPPRQWGYQLAVLWYRRRLGLGRRG